MSLISHSILPDETKYKRDYISNLDAQKRNDIGLYNPYRIHIYGNGENEIKAEYFPVKVSNRIQKLSVSINGDRVKIGNLSSALATPNKYSLLLVSKYTIDKTEKIWEKIPSSIRTRLLGKKGMKPILEPTLTYSQYMALSGSTKQRSRELVRRDKMEGGNFPQSEISNRKTLIPLVTYFRTSMFMELTETTQDPRDGWLTLLRHLANNYRFKSTGIFDVLRLPLRDSPQTYEESKGRNSLTDTAKYYTMTKETFPDLVKIIMEGLYNGWWAYWDNDTSHTDFGGFSGRWEILPITRLQEDGHHAVNDNRKNPRGSRAGAAFPRFEIFTNKIRGTPYYDIIKKIHNDLQIYSEYKISVDDSDGMLQYCFAWSVYTSLKQRYGKLPDGITLERLMFCTSVHASKYGGLSKIDNLRPVIECIDEPLEVQVRYHQPGRTEGDRTKSRKLELRSAGWVKGCPTAFVYLSVEANHYIASYMINELKIYPSGLMRLKDGVVDFTGEKGEMPILSTIEYVKLLMSEEFAHLTREESVTESMCKLSYKAPYGYLHSEVDGDVLVRLQEPYVKVPFRSKRSGGVFEKQEMVDRIFVPKVFIPSDKPKAQPPKNLTGPQREELSLIIRGPRSNIAKRLWAKKVEDMGVDPEEYPFDEREFYDEVDNEVKRMKKLIKDSYKSQERSEIKEANAPEQDEDTETPVRLVLDTETWGYVGQSIIIPNHRPGQATAYAVCVRDFSDTEVQGKFTGFDCTVQALNYIEDRYGVKFDSVTGQYPDSCYSKKQLAAKDFLTSKNSWVPRKLKRVVIFMHNSKFDCGVMLPAAKFCGFTIDDRCINNGKPVSYKLSKAQGPNLFLEIEIRDSYRIMNCSVANIPKTFFMSKGDEDLLKKYSEKDLFCHECACEETIDPATGCLRNDITTADIAKYVNRRNALPENKADQFNLYEFLVRLHPYTSDEGVVRLGDYSLKYCSRDCDLVAEGLHKMDQLLIEINHIIHNELGTEYRELEMLPSQAYSCSGLSDRLYQHHGCFKDVYCQRGPLQDFIRAFTAGGRVMLGIKPGETKERKSCVDGKSNLIGCQDMNSMYPSSQRALPHGYPRGRMERPEDLSEGTCMTKVVARSVAEKWQGYLAVMRVKPDRVSEFKVRDNLSFGIYPHRKADGTQLGHEDAVLDWRNDVHNIPRLYMSNIRFDDFCITAGVSPDMFELVGDRQILYWPDFYRFVPREFYPRDDWSEGKNAWLERVIAKENAAKPDELERERAEYVPAIRVVTDTLYSQRMTARACGASGMDELIKLMMNSSYGRLMMTLNGSSNTLVHGKSAAWTKVASAPSKYTEFEYLTHEDDPEQRTVSLVTQSRWTECKPNRIAAGCLVLDQARALFNPLVMCAAMCGKSLLYTDTDSCMLHIADQDEINAKHIELYGKSLIGDGLGLFSTDLKMDGKKSGVVCIDAVFLGKKSYCMKLFNTHSGKTDFKVSMKGASDSAIKLECVRRNQDKLQLFKSLYDGKEVIFDNGANGKCRFVSEGGLSNPKFEIYRYLGSMERTFKF